MSYVPLSLPEMGTRDLVAGAPQVPFWYQVGESFANSIPQTIEGSLIQPLTHLYDKWFGQEKNITGEEAKLKYPNVDFPQGGDENVIKMVSDNKARNDFTNTLLSQSSHPWIPQTLGFLAASYMMPSGALLGKLGSSTADQIGSYFAPKVTTEAQALGVKAVSGFGGTVAAVLPMLGAQAVAMKQIQEPMTTEDFFKNLFIMGGIGGALHTAFGSKIPLSAEDQKTSYATAMEQIKEGKIVNVAPIIQDALSKIPLEELKPETFAESIPVEIKNKINNDSTLYEELQNNKPNPITPSELANQREQMLSWESNHDVFPNEYRRNEFVKGEYATPEEEMKLYQDHIESLRANQQLTSEDEQVLQRLDELDKNEGNVNQALKDFVNCVNLRGLE